MNSRLEKIKTLQKKKAELLKQIKNNDTQITEIDDKISKLIIKKLKNQNKKFEIICECENVYQTDKDPFAKKAIQRPQCNICAVRVKRKLTITRKDQSQRLQKLWRDKKR